MSYKLYHRFSPPQHVGRTDFGPSMTRQEFKDECDINRIMAQALKTGTIAQRPDLSRYGDFSQADDFHSAQNLIIKARGQFDALPSKVRDRFGNDPEKFLAFIHDPKTTVDDCHELGILSLEASERHIAQKKAVETKPAP